MAGELSFRVGRGAAEPGRVIELGALFDALFEGDPPLADRRSLADETRSLQLSASGSAAALAGEKRQWSSRAGPAWARRACWRGRSGRGGHGLSTGQGDGNQGSGGADGRSGRGCPAARGSGHDARSSPADEGLPHHMFVRWLYRFGGNSRLPRFSWHNTKSSLCQTSSVVVGLRVRASAGGRPPCAWGGIAPIAGGIRARSTPRICWDLAGAQARARPMRWLFFATDPGRTAKWTCPCLFRSDRYVRSRCLFRLACHPRARWLALAERGARREGPGVRGRCFLAAGAVTGRAVSCTIGIWSPVQAKPRRPWLAARPVRDQISRRHQVRRRGVPQYRRRR